MTESVLTSQLARLRVAYAGTALHRFLTWWGRELAALVPARVRDWFMERREEVRAGIEGAELVLTPPAPAAPVRIALAQDSAAVRPAVAQALVREEEPPAVFLALQGGRLLHRTLSLPMAAEENLRQVLGFELDRQTPFRAEQVYFDCRVQRRDLAARQLVAEFALVPRAAVDAELAALEAAGVPLEAMDGVDGAGARLGYNLLPRERRAPRARFWLKVNLALAALALLLLFAVMAQSVANRERALADLEAQTDKAQVEARSVATLRNTLKQAIDGASFLTERKGARPPTIDVMLDLTRRLPADTWLQRFSVNADQVQLQGQSREAAALITLLQQSPYLEGPALQGAITPDARTGKEQFLIQAKLRNPPAPAAPAAPAATPAAPPEAPVTPASGPKPEPVPVAQPEKPDAVAS